MSLKDKKFLEKLMRLDTPKAEEYLTNYATNIKEKILSSSDNEDILDNLKLLAQFIYRVPDTALEIIDFIIKKKTPNPPKRAIGILVFTHKELIMECCGLLEQIRYYRPVEVLERLVYIYQADYNKIDTTKRPNYYRDTKKEAEQAIKKLIEYNYHSKEGNKIYLSVQRIILDATHEWDLEFKQQNIPIIKIIIEEILSLDVRGFEQTTVNTFTLKTAALEGSDYLKSLRKEAIDFIFDLLDHTKDLNDKIHLIKILHAATRFPDHSRSEGTEQMVYEDVNYLIDYFNSILFQDKKLVADAPLVQEVENCFQFFIINKNQFDKLPKLKELIKTLNLDDFYSRYKAFVNEYGDSRIDDTGVRTRDKKDDIITECFEKFNEQNFDEQFKFLQKIASYSKCIDDWKMQPFRKLLVDIAHRKNDQLVEHVLQESLKPESSLYGFVYNLMCGLRARQSRALWDKYADEIASEHPNLISSVFMSISAVRETEVEKKDIELLEQIVFKRGIFKDLEKEIFDSYHLRIRVMDALCSAFLSKIELTEPLIREEMSNFPNHRKDYLNSFQFCLYKHEELVNKTSKEMREFLMNQIVEVPKLNFSEEILLLEYGRNDFSLMMDTFWKRIKRNITEKKKPIEEDSDELSPENYEALPRHLNHDLTEFIAQHKDYNNIIQEWIGEMPPHPSTLSREIENFFNQIGTYDSRKKMLLKLIDSGNLDNISRTTLLMDNSEEPDFELCFYVIKNIDLKKNKNITDRISSMLASTGVVSGDDGILNAYQRKLARVKEESQSTKNQNIKTFCKEQIKYFEAHIEHETKNLEEERKLRDIEFNSQ